MTVMDEKFNTLRRLQEQVLIKLATSSFAEQGMLYGSSLLSHFYGLPRWSADLDFLAYENVQYDFISDILILEKELPGCKVHAEKNAWNVIVGQIEFIKERLTVGIDVSLYLNPYAEMQTQVLGKISIPTLAPACQLGAKTHAVLFRNTESRFKPQDFFDLQWMIKKDVPIHLDFIVFEMQQSHLLNTFETLSISQLKSKLKKVVINIPKETLAADPLAQHNISREELLQTIERMRCL